MKSKKIRIISGQFGSRQIDTPDSNATHPMGDRERSAIFNRLRGELVGCDILDAFAGSGALGLEAVSLGAKSVTFLEKHPVATRTIKANMQKLSITGEVVKSIDNLTEYDVIFIDPPYDNPQYDLVYQIISHVRKGGYVVLSHPANPAPPEFDALELISDKKYAAAHIKIYKNNR